MAKNQPDVEVIEGLKGSEQHHPLRNQPGEKGDPDHAKGSPSNGSEKKQRD